MLNKNVYIIYPAGFHGSYVKWAIESSDPANKSITKNPINTVKSTAFGGVGTAHHFERLPTHQSFDLTVLWIMYNQPQDKRVYLINSGVGRTIVSKTISDLLLYDRDGIIISIHDNDDELYSSYGKINCVTKWPTFMLATKSDWYSGFDAFDCAKDRKFRNYIVKNDFLGSCGPPNLGDIDRYLDEYACWYKVRNQYQPHEVNLDNYPPRPVIADRLFDLSLEDIIFGNFQEKISDIIRSTNLMDNLDFSNLNAIHDQYIDTQPNLQWFESIKHWQKTKTMDDYLCSHSVIESQLIKYIFRQSDTVAVRVQTDIVWQDLETVDISDFYHNESVKKLLESNSAKKRDIQLAMTYSLNLMKQNVDFTVQQVQNFLCSAYGFDPDIAKLAAQATFPE